MPIDLEGPRRQVEDLMVDDIRVEWVARDADKVFNETTGRYDPVEPELLFEGKALISTNAQEPRERLDGGTRVDNTLYRMRIPAHDTDRIRRDAKVIVLRCDNSPQLVGVTFRVEQEIHSTYTVSRTFQMVLEDKVVD